MREPAAMRSGGLAAVAAVLDALLMCAAAQGVARPDSSLPPGRLQGSVVASTTSIPIEDAIVSISPAGGGALLAWRGSAFWEASRSARTNASGIYRFDGLAPGRYQMHIQRIGYRSADIEVDLADAAPVRVSVGLLILPIVLEPVTVRALASAGSTHAARGEWDAIAQARVAAEAERRRRFLASDTRSLTTADLTEAVTLGETDLFRALQRVAGVTTRDEYTAELWTRGGRWSETRVTYDGLPLFSPLHAGGALSGVPPDVVGSALFHPGVRSAASGEGAAATLELASRPASEPGLRGLAELSTLSARATLERGGSGEGARWVLGGRRSYIDLATKLLAAFATDPAAPIRYSFTDLAGRLDIPLGAASALEVSGLWSGDALGGTVPRFVDANRGRWGNALMRATVVAPLAGVSARHTLGFSRYSLRVASCSDPSCAGSSPTKWRLDSRSALTYVVVSTALGSTSGDGWTGGYQLAAQRLEYDGWGPVAYPGNWVSVRARLRGATDVLSIWTEQRSRLGQRLTLQTGLRVETGSKVAGASPVRIAPRFQARYALLRDDLLLSGGVGRSFQYSQAVGPLGPGIGPELHLSDVWILAGDTIPAIRSDVASAGLEYWFGGGWVSGLNLYWRGERGVAVPDPTPGGRYSDPDGANIFVVGATATRGAEISLRKLTGRLTGSASLSLSHTTISALGFHYRAPTDRPVVLHGTGLVALRNNLRLGGAFTLAASAPFTRNVMWSACDDSIPDCPPSAGRQPPYVETPSGARAPAIAVLDLLADWNKEFRGWTLAAYLQLRNVLRGTRAVTYTGSIDRCASAPAPNWVLVRPGMCDSYARGLPMLPLAGVRVSF